MAKRLETSCAACCCAGEKRTSRRRCGPSWTQRDQAQGFVLATLVGVFGDRGTHAFDDGSQRWLDAHHEVVALTDQFELRLPIR
jgi:hypothetical protein